MNKLEWKKRLKNHRFFCSVLTLASGTAVGQVILVLAMPILTRFYMPEDFGVLAVFSAFLGVGVVVSALRYELAIPLPRSERSGQQLVAIALLLNALTALFVLIVVSFLRQDIAEWVKSPALINYLWLLPAGVVSAGAYKIFNYWAVRNKNFKDVAHTKFIQSIVIVSVQLSVGLSGSGALGLIAGQLVGQAVGVFRLSKDVALFSFLKKNKASFLRFKALVKRYNRFPKYDAPASAIDTMSTQLPNVLLAAFFNPTVAGYYLLTERALALPMSLVGQAVGQVFYSDCREALRSRSLERTSKLIVINLIMLITLPVILIFFFGSDLFPLVFGARWYEAGSYAEWMILGAAVQFVYSPISMVLMATNGQKLNLCIHVVMLLSKGGVVLCAYHLDSPLVAIIGFSITGMFIYGFGIFLILLRARKYDSILSTSIGEAV